MNKIAVHMRITGLSVSNEDVDTRKAAVADLAKMWARLRNKTQMVQKASEIAKALSGDGAPPESLGVEVQGVVQEHASAFLHSERPLEVGICAGVVAIELLGRESGSSGFTPIDVLATALWSAVGFQPELEDAKREALRVEVLEAARLRTMKAAESGRVRTDVGEFGHFTIREGKSTEVPANFKKATASTIGALRRNAALDREELDFLWWSLLGRSRILGVALQDLDETVRLIAMGIEAASHLRRLPSEGHRDVVLRTLDTNPDKDLRDLLDAVGDKRNKLAARYTEVDCVVSGTPDVFPLLYALAENSALGDGARIPRPAAEWGARALLEAGLVMLLSTGVTEL